MSWYKDPLASSQWHLYSIGLDRLGVEYNGRSVKVGIFDDGLQSDHPDLAGAYNPELNYSFGGQLIDPGTGVHGTAVAGIIAAQANGVGGVGVASGAKITGVNIFSGPAALSLSSTIAQMKKFDVVNNSWGSAGSYSDDPNQSFGLGGDFQRALDHAAKHGRSGLGTVIVNAAGNDWTYDHRDANTSAFSQDRHTITVGAVADSGQVSAYSTRGASVLVSAPSSGGAHGITTTDVSGGLGYGAGEETSAFGGTSAAAPIVSGVAALMLEANGRLGWRDVQAILAYSADHVGPGIGHKAQGSHAFTWTTNGADNFNGGGLHFSNDVGFGKIDAYTAVRMAEVWSHFGRSRTSANEAMVSAGGSRERAIQDRSTTAFTFKVAKATDLEHVDLTLTLDHGDVSQLAVELISPEGTRSLLLTPGGDSQRVRDWTWTLGSEAFRGESSKGLWTVRVTDTKGGHAGSINDFEFRGYGDRSTRNDVYHFTDEFGALARADGSRAVISDRDGGTDWLNLAGIAADVQVSLAARSLSTIAGQGSFRIAKGTVIENAVTGDGNDFLSGNARDNRLLGMRGDDWLVGGGGRDRLDGGAGLDTADYSGSRAAVSIDLQSGRGSGGDARGDRLSGIETLVGSRFGDQLAGNAFENRLDGRGGNDVLAGGGGADTFVFSAPGFGHDTVLDFEDGADRLDFSALHLEASAIGITASALGTVVTTPHGLVELRGIGAPSITLDDFVL